MPRRATPMAPPSTHRLFSAVQMMLMEVAAIAVVP
jgi:hypothetical protein